MYTCGYAGAPRLVQSPAHSNDCELTETTTHQRTGRDRCSRCIRASASEERHQDMVAGWNTSGNRPPVPAPVEETGNENRELSSPLSSPPTSPADVVDRTGSGGNTRPERQAMRKAATAISNIVADLTDSGDEAELEQELKRRKGNAPEEEEEVEQPQDEEENRADEEQIEGYDDERKAGNTEDEEGEKEEDNEDKWPTKPMKPTEPRPKPRTPSVLPGETGRRSEYNANELRNYRKALIAYRKQQSRWQQFCRDLTATWEAIKALQLQESESQLQEDLKEFSAVSYGAYQVGEGRRRRACKLG